MKKRVALSLFAIVVALASLPAANVASQKRSRVQASYVKDRILVKLRAEAAPFTDEFQLAEQLFPARRTRAEKLGALDEYAPETDTFVVHLDGEVSVEEAIRQASLDPRVEYAEPDYLVYPADTTPDDPAFTLQWGMSNFQTAGADIGAKQAWDLTTGSPDVVAAVIDTGVDLSHPDLTPNAWVNPGEIPGNGFDDDGNGFADDVNGWNFLADNNVLYESPSVDRHGTHVAGILGAAGNNGIGVTGVAWQVKLMSLKFIGLRDGELSGTVSDAVKAIKYTTEQRKRGINIRVINASWGEAPDSQSLRKAIKKAGKEGILFVTAAGNGGPDGRGDDLDQRPDYPAAYSAQLPAVISVASLNIADTRSASSNFGHTTVNVGAPGVQVYSTVPAGGYAHLSGTSMAAPHVAGIAVLLWSREPHLTPEQVKERIVKTAQPILALASVTVSSARANAFNALTNTIPAARQPAISAVQVDKKWVTVDGLYFLNGSSVVEINGVERSGKTQYDSAFSLANGSLTRFRVKLGTSGVEAAFPQGAPVTITVFNRTTGERSAPYTFVRF